MTTKVECRSCGEVFSNICSHWAQSNCKYPDLSKEQKEVLTGALMGDGYIDHQNGCNPFFECQSTTKEYLKYFDNIFGKLSNGISVFRTQKESYESAINSSSYFIGNKDNYSTVYRFRTKTNPKFKEFSNWYSSGSKVWPNNINLTPTILKNWYCCDGHFSNKNSNRQLIISAENEIGNIEKIERIFSESRLPKPNSYSSGNLVWNVEGSEKLFKYMGSPLPGFNYKWPNNYVEA